MAAELSPENAPLTFAEMQQFYKLARTRIPSLQKKTMPEVAMLMNRATVSNLFDQGLEDTYTKRYSAAVDRFIQPVSSRVGEAGAQLFDKIGLEKYREQARGIGESLPRGAAEAAPTALGFGMLLAPEPTGLSKAAGLAMMGAGVGSAYAGGFEKTGSRTAGLVNAASMATFPAVARLGQAAVKPLIKSQLYKKVTTSFPGLEGLQIAPKTSYVPKLGQGAVTGMAERAIELAGINTALTAHQIVSMGAERKIAGRPAWEFTPEYAIDLAGGILPFALVDAIRIVKGPTPLRGEQAGRRVGPRSNTAAEFMQEHANIQVARQIADDAINMRKEWATKKRVPLGLPWSEPPWGMGPPDRRTFVAERPPVPPIEKTAPVWPVKVRSWNNVIKQLDRRGKISVNEMKGFFRMSDEEATSTYQRLLDRKFIDEQGNSLTRFPDDTELLEEARNLHKLATGRSIVYPHERPQTPETARRRKIEYVPPEPEQGELRNRRDIETTTGRPVDFGYEPLPDAPPRETPPPELPVFEPTEPVVDPNRPQVETPPGAEPIKVPPVSKPYEPPPLITDAEGNPVAPLAKSVESLPPKLKGEATSMQQRKEIPTEWDRQVKILQRGTEAEQLINQFLLRFGEEEAVRLTKPRAPVTIDEELNRIYEVTNRLHTLIEEATGEHTKRSLLENEVELRKLVQEQIRLGRSEVEALEIARRKSMARLASVLEEVVRLEEQGRMEFHQGEIGTMSNTRIKELETLYDKLKDLDKIPGPVEVQNPQGHTVTVDYQRAVAEVTSEDPWRTGGSIGQKGITGDAGERSRTWIFGAAVDWFTKLTPEQRADIVAKWTRRNEDQAALLHPTEIEREAFKGYLRTAAILRARTLERDTKVEAIGVDSQELTRLQIENDPLMSEEDIALHEAQEDHAAALGVMLRKFLPLREYSGLEIRAALETAGTPTSKLLSQSVERVNTLLKMFYDNQIGIGPDPQNRGSDVIIKLHVRTEEVGRILGINQPRKVMYFIQHTFQPFMKGMIKRMQRAAEPELARKPDEGSVTETAGFKAFHDAVSQAGATKYTTMAGAKAFFTTLFAHRGYSEADIKSYSDVATKIAAAYYDIGFLKLGEVVSNEVWGAAYRTRGYPQFIGLSGALGKRTKNPYVNVFHALQIGAHELMHGMLEARVRDLLPTEQSVIIDNFVTKAMDMTPEDRSNTAARWFNIMVPASMRDVPFANEMRTRAGQNVEVGEFLADLGGMIALSVGSPDFLTKVSAIGRELTFSPEHEAQFMRAMYLPIHDLYSGLESYFAGSAGDKVLSSKIGEIAGGIKSVLRTSEFTGKALQALNSIRAHDPQGFMKLMTDSNLPKFHHRWYEELEKIQALGPRGDSSVQNSIIGAAKDFLGLGNRAKITAAFGIKPNWYESWFYPSAQLAKTYPQLADVMDAGFAFSSIMKDGIVRMLEPFGVKTSATGHVSLDRDASTLYKLRQNPRLAKAASAVSLIKQIDETKVLSDAEMRAVPEVAALSAEDQATVIGFQRAAEKAMPNVANMMVHHWTRNELFTLIDIVQHSARELPRPLTAKQATEVTTMLHESMTGIRTLNPTEAAFVQNTLGPTVMGKIVTEAPKLRAATLKLKKELENKPSYMPEPRLGEFVVAWKWPTGTAGHKSGRLGFETELQAVEYKKKMETKGAMARVFAKSDQRSQNQSMDSETIRRFAEIEDATLQAAANALGRTPDLDALLKEYRPGVATSRDVFTRAVEQHLKKRNLAEGREELNTVDSVINYFSTLSAAMAKGEVRRRANIALRDPDLAKNPKLQALGRDHINTVTDPPAREWTTFKNLNFGYFMGFNVSTMMIEASQNFLTFAPYLTRETGSVASSYKYLGRGVKSFVDAMRTGTFADPELNTAVVRARNEGVIDAGTIQDLYGVEDTMLPNMRSMGSGSSVFTKAVDLVKKPAWWYLKAARAVYSIMPRINAHVAFTASYMLAKDKGMVGEAAYNFARTATRTTQFSGGLASRPVRAFNPGINEHGWGSAHPIVGILYSLQGYTFSTIAMMARLGKEAISSDPAIPAASKSAARKAFGQMMLTQFAFGGALSMPFTAGMVALLEQMFPDLELRRGARETIQNLFDSDEDLGNLVSDVALKGGLTTSTGLDFSSRFGLGNLFGVSAYDGFSLANLVGPTGQIFENLHRGLQESSTGNLAQAAQSALPIAYRNVLDLANNDWQLRSRSGELIHEPSTVEAALYTLGLRPKALSDYREAQIMVSRTNEIHSRELEQFHSRLADELQGGNFGKVRQGLLQRALDDKLYDARTGAKRVAELGVARNLPADLTLNGPKSAGRTRMSIASMYDRQAPTEMQRLLQRQSLEKLLGLHTSPSPREISATQLVDRLIAAGIDRPTAKLIASRKLGMNMDL